MIIKIQEDTLAVKLYLDRCAATFGVKVHRYHADIVIFSEQPFVSSIEYANQTITFCGVGYHHQSSIFERKNQTLTLGSITFILNEKIYFPEAITTMLCNYTLKASGEKLN